jgi:hypothetical protein
MTGSCAGGRPNSFPYTLGVVAGTSASSSSPLKTQLSAYTGQSEVERSSLKQQENPTDTTSQPPNLPHSPFPFRLYGSA